MTKQARGDYLSAVVAWKQTAAASGSGRQSRCQQAARFEAFSTVAVILSINVRSHRMEDAADRMLA